MAIKKYKITNISRGVGKPGVMLDLGTTDNGQPKNIIHPGNFAIVSEGDMNDSFFGWQRSGYAKIDVIGESVFEELNKAMPDVHAKATDALIDPTLPDDGDIDIEEPDVDINMAVDATLPMDGLVAQGKASQMGQDTQSLGKGDVDATNPLLDETPKAIDNSNGKFVANSKPLNQGKGKAQNQGRTIVP
jgi:hypothetical protein